MDEYKTFLATKVVNEDLIINYRQLSRALKVHTHLAKQMLYDFHHKQTSKKPGSLHATYHITGILKADQDPTSQPTNGFGSHLDEDTPMESSPFPSSLPEPNPTPSFESEDAEPVNEPVQNTSVLLVREEELEEAKEDFEEIYSIFVYSIEPGPLKDFQLLTQCNKEVTQQFWTEDPLQAYPKYGLLTNTNVKRRTGKRPPPPAASTAAASKMQPAKSTPAKNVKPEVAVKQEPTSKPAATSSKPIAPKRQSSDMLKNAFAKSKPPTLKTNGSNATSASGSAAQSPVDEDTEMQDEPEEEDLEALEAEHEKAAEARRIRKEKQDKLKKMMEEEDEDEEMADAGAAEEPEAEEEEQEQVDETAALDKPAEEEKKEHVTVEGGRRRGRRRVTKKRTYKDEDGYLVTKEEPGWESFSEEEPVPKKPKVNVPQAATKKAAPAAKGQNTLMNFFKKK